MAEAISKVVASDVYDAYSAGEVVADKIDPGAVNIIKKLYDVDMSLSQKPKPVNDIPVMDIVVKMGCGIKCPHKYNRYAIDWDIHDPKGSSEEEYEEIAKLIESKIIELRNEIKNA
jgi:arsenate reductase